jgi:diacylglycerol kinase
LKKRIKAFKDALNGWVCFWRDGVHPKIQILAALLAVVGATFLQFSKTEWALLLLVIGLVVVAEMFNSVLEGLMDHVTPTPHPTIGKLKDMAAGAVLMAAIVALIFGVMVFLPKLMIKFAI